MDRSFGFGGCCARVPRVPGGCQERERDPSLLWLLDVEGWVCRTPASPTPVLSPPAVPTHSPHKGSMRPFWAEKGPGCIPLPHSLRRGDGGPAASSTRVGTSPEGVPEIGVPGGGQRQIHPPKLSGWGLRGSSSPPIIQTRGRGGPCWPSPSPPGVP